MKRNLLLSALVMLLASSCFRLDSVLYNPDGSITSYRFDDYPPDNWDFVLGPEFDVPDSLIHLMSLPARLPHEDFGEFIYAVYIGDTSRISTDTVIVYCHGNGAHMDQYWQRAKLLANIGHTNRFGVMMMDYHGYGLSGGVPTEEALYTDVQACIDWLAGRGLTGERMALYGFSMGTAPAVELTAHPRSLVPGWLITEAPFASAEQMGQSSTGLAIPGSFVTDLQINNEDEIKLVQQPFLWIHGTADDYLDFENHGQVVFDNYQGTRGVAVPVQGANHGNVPAVMGIEPYRHAMLDFLLNR